MISNNSPELKAPQSGTARSVATEDPVPPMKPDDGIEVASEGGGTVNDPGGTDKKPPNFDDLEHFV